MRSSVAKSVAMLARARWIIALSLSLIPSIVSAQDSTARHTPTPGGLAAAKELLVLMNTEDVMQVAITATFDAQMEAQPLMAPFKDVMLDWAKRTITMENMAAQLAAAYAEFFSEPELRQLIAFYKSPIGRRLAATLPALTRRGSEIGAAVAEAHTTELEEAIAKRAAEIQGAPTPTPP
ncbi:MAG: DUF2059 domain-containing protein [Gemmatimonadaceae bacterium]